jgi:8-oxo-dGTP diphosphatase
MQPFANPKAIEVAAGLVFRGGHLLITQRSPEAHCGGLWEFPGGKREAGESFEECLKRELREELGIEVKVREMIESLRHDYPDKSVFIKFFHCEWLENEPRPLHCHDLAWISAVDLSRYQFPAADARLLEKLGDSLLFSK